MQVSTTIRKWESFLGVGLTLCAVGLLVSAGCQTGGGGGPPPCENDAACADTLFCNGDETCVDGECQPGTAPCTAATVECNEETNVCDRVCLEDVGCNDNNECTDDACVAGVCRSRWGCSRGTPAALATFCIMMSVADTVNSPPVMLRKNAARWTT